MSKCEHPTIECHLVSCNKTEVCTKYLFSLPLEERLKFRLTWMPLMDYYKAKALILPHEKGLVRLVEMPKPKKKEKDEWEWLTPMLTKKVGVNQNNSKNSEFNKAKKANKINYPASK